MITGRTTDWRWGGERDEEIKSKEEMKSHFVSLFFPPLSFLISNPYLSPSALLSLCFHTCTVSENICLSLNRKQMKHERVQMVRGSPACRTASDRLTAGSLHPPPLPPSVQPLELMSVPGELWKCLHLSQGRHCVKHVQTTYLPESAHGPCLVFHHTWVGLRQASMGKRLLMFGYEELKVM